ncbi:MAG: cytochrome c oxidase subunit 3 family protein [Porticoccaceae bacterium]|nr:cytochrome c oxidase subunit 3 family protein [Porticoccaceae bacterium]
MHISESAPALLQVIAAPGNDSRDHATPGSTAVWILIYAELTEFALFFIVFLIAKVFNPEVFAAGPQQLNTSAGVVNTLVLLTSSFFIARAVAAMKHGNTKKCLRWLLLTVAAGAVYCGIKLWEHQWNLDADITINTNLFFSLYYYLGFNHFLHVAIGSCAVLWAALNTHLNNYSKDDHEGLESVACYWHMIDLVWVIIFPLLYVLG